MSANVGWAAGVAFIAIAWAGYVFLFPDQNGKRDLLMTRLWEGADGRASFSKFQFWLWTLVITLCLFSVWVTRMVVSEGVVSPIDDIPETVLGLLGISAFTALGAKGITTNYVARSVSRKPSKKPGDKSTPASELLSDDGGIPELAKLQMFLFTLVSIVFFLITVADNINSGIVSNLVLPDLDQSLLVLMGVSSGGYLGKKFITRERPTISGILPSEVLAGTATTVMLMGRALGTKEIGVLAVGPRLYKTDEEKQAANIDWTDSVINFDFDGNLPEGQYLVEVVVGDSKSEPQVLRVTGGAQTQRRGRSP